jgi:hypothetical protein
LRIGEVGRERPRGGRRGGKNKGREGKRIWMKIS